MIHLTRLDTSDARRMKNLVGLSEISNLLYYDSARINLGSLLGGINVLGTQTRMISLTWIICGLLPENWSS